MAIVGLSESLGLNGQWGYALSWSAVKERYPAAAGLPPPLSPQPPSHEATSFLKLTPTRYVVQLPQPEAGELLDSAPWASLRP